MFVDYVKKTWLIPHKLRFVKAWTNKVFAHGLPRACELARYALGSISLNTIYMFWRKLSFLDQGLSEPEVSITEEMEVISNRFEELDVCGKVILKRKL